MGLSDKVQAKIEAEFQDAYKKSPEAKRIRDYHLQKCRLAIITAMQVVTESLMAIDGNEITVLIEESHTHLKRAESAIS